MKNCLLFVAVLLALPALSQDSLAAQKTSAYSFKSRQWIVGAAAAATYGGSFVFLNTAWYKDYPKTAFHTFNDSGEWLQVDKVGHAWSTYHTSRINTQLWRWAGLSRNQALAAGTGSSFLYMLSIEYLDGHSADWGWSWSDVGANLFGASLFASQDVFWKEQKIAFKFSSHTKNYGQHDLQRRADDLFGNSFQGRLLKDYNAQTYWLSANIKSFLPKAALPDWLNLAVGYGAEGMFGGYQNIAIDKNGILTFDRKDIKRYREWYLSPDIDFTRIKTRHKFLKAAFSALNVLKFPAPALEFSKGRLKMRGLVF